MHKEGYGKNPEYLDEIKQHIQKEYDMIQNLHSERQVKKYFYL